MLLCFFCEVLWSAIYKAELILKISLNVVRLWVRHYIEELVLNVIRFFVRFCGVQYINKN